MDYKNKMKIFGLVMLISGIFVIVVGMFWAAFWRDGSAPGFTHSTGYTAIIRTILDGVYSLILGFIMLITGIICFLRSKNSDGDNDLPIIFPEIK
jgi:uncharacterized membrane protein